MYYKSGVVISNVMNVIVNEFYFILDTEVKNDFKRKCTNQYGYYGTTKTRGKRNINPRSDLNIVI